MIHGEYGKFGEYPASSIPCTGCTSSALPWNSDVTRPGKRLHNYGKSPFSMGKSTINGPCSIANC